jgi:hypothetical protein
MLVSVFPIPLVFFIFLSYPFVGHYALKKHKLGGQVCRWQRTEERKRKGDNHTKKKKKKEKKKRKKGTEDGFTLSTQQEHDHY